MQPQLRPGAGGTLSPAPAPLSVVPPPPARLHKLWLVLGLLAAVGAGALLYQSAAKKAAQNSAQTLVLRTATVTSGTVARTIRLTGATSAANFVSLTAPQLRGSRGGGGGSSSSTSTSSTTAASTSTAAAVPAASTSTSSLSPALQSATSRIGAKKSATSASSSSSATPAASTAMGGDGIGSTSGELNSGSPGGGSNDDFALVLQKLAKPGFPVKKGELVAEFDRESMLNRLDDYHASVAQSEASFRRLQAESEITRHAHEQLISSAKGDLDKARLDMKTLPVLGEMDKERLKLALDEAEARYKQLLAEVVFTEAQIQSQIRSSELALKQSQLELKRAQANADRMLVHAGISGLAVMESTFRGNEFGQIRQGDQVRPGQLFMKIVDTASMVINGTVNQVDVDRLRIGAKAEVHFDAYPDLTLPAHVYSIGAMTRLGMFRANYFKEIPVSLKLDRMDPRVIPDLTVSIDVAAGAPKTGTTAPLAAIQHEQGGQPFVYVRDDSGWSRRPVELGMSNYTHVVIESGLKAGEVVALEPPQTQQAGR